MSTLTKYPAYRRSLAPEGFCIHCWARGGPPVPGEPFVMGYPSTHPGEGLAYYCAPCQEKCAAMGIQLIPPSPELLFALELTKASR